MTWNKSFRNDILNSFTKKSGLSLKKESVDYIENALQQANLTDAQIPELLIQMASVYSQHYVESKLVDQSQLEGIVTAVIEGEHSPDGEGAFINEDAFHHFQVIPAQDVPTLQYNCDQKTFEKVKHKKSSFSDPNSKAAIFRQRYHLLRQRILRSEHFTPSTVVTSSDQYLRLTAITSLKGRRGQDFLLFGMISQLEEGKYYLEDLESSILLDLSECCKTSGIFTESCFVLVEGELDEMDVFKVHAIGLPPPENRKTSDAIWGHLDFFGGRKEVKDLESLERIEKGNDSYFVFFSDVWLDQPKVLDKLKSIFRGYAAIESPLIFIFIGSFISTPYLHNGQYSALYKASFDKLADIILENGDFAQRSHFVFIPGPNDPVNHNVTPRSSISEFYTSKLRQKLSNITFSTSPCRIRFCSQEIVIYREDIVSKMLRNCILNPNPEEKDLKKQVVQTLLYQSFLSPLPLHVRPIFWDYASTLSLYPLPDLLVLADKCSVFKYQFEGTLALNPGSLPNTDFRWAVYYPSDRSIEYSQLPS